MSVLQKERECMQKEIKAYTDTVKSGDRENISTAKLRAQKAIQGFTRKVHEVKKSRQ